MSREKINNVESRGGDSSQPYKIKRLNEAQFPLVSSSSLFRPPLVSQQYIFTWNLTRLVINVNRKTARADLET